MTNLSFSKKLNFLGARGTTEAYERFGVDYCWCIYHHVYKIIFILDTSSNEIVCCIDYKSICTSPGNISSVIVLQKSYHETVGETEDKTD